MKSLLRMTEQDVAELDAVQGFRWKSAFQVSAGAAVLAFFGMVLRYSPGDDVPVSGMDELSGQLFLSAALGTTMLATAWAVRDVIMKRLQWAVLLSLLVHVVLCLAMNFMAVGLPGSALAEIGTEDIPDRQLALPDYGGMEATSVAPQEWEQPTDVELTETVEQQLDRQSSEAEFQAEPDQVQHETVVASIDNPTRQQQREEMQEALDVELNRQIQDIKADSPDQLEEPTVEETASTEQPELQPQQMEAATRERLMTTRQTEQVEASRAPEIAAAQMENRSDVQPDKIENTQFENASRESAEANAAATDAESVEMAETKSARQSQTQARAMDSARRSEVDLPNRQSEAESAPRTQSAPAVASQAPSRSSAASQSAASSTPSGGAASSIQRSQTSSARSTASANATAAGVNVAAASRSNAPGLSASSSASEVARGQSAVPSSSAAGGSGLPATRRSPTGAASLQAGRIGRRSGTGSGPQMGSEVGSGLMGGGQSRSRSASGGGTGAVGTQAQEVAVGQAANGGTGRGVLGSGPSSSVTNVGRNSGSLPSGTGGAGQSSAPPSGARNGQGTGSLAMRAKGRGGLTGRATEPTAKLGSGLASGTGAAGRTGRRSASANLPAGALRAEAAGSLVIAGPQSEGGTNGSNGTTGRSGSTQGQGKSGRSSGRLGGPRMGAVARRSSGLPGSGGRLPSVGRTRPGLPGASGSKGLASRSGTGGAKPSMASPSELAGLIRRSVPGISPIPTDRVSAGFSMRKPETRREAVRNLGGNEASEAAVERGLKWLADHQYAAGNWSIHNLNCKDHNCQHAGTYKADSAATGLALLTFLGAGYTHNSGEYQAVVGSALQWLIKNQKPDGDLYTGGSKFTWFYSHGMAAIALCEAYGMTKDPQLREPAQRALDFIVKSQHPDFGGWRYEPRFESDTSVSGWQLMALKSGEMAGLKIPRATYGGVSRWLDSIESKESPGQFAYHSSKSKSLAMTAEGLLMRQYLGADRDDSNLTAGADFLKLRLPRDDARDVYYWYYATQVMFHMQGEHWEKWNEQLRDRLVDSQSKDGPDKGSWNPVGPSKDQWGQSGGRHYVTCLDLLMLEVYYRHLPLYIDLDQ